MPGAREKCRGHGKNAGGPPFEKGGPPDPFQENLMGWGGVLQNARQVIWLSARASCGGKLRRGQAPALRGIWHWRGKILRQEDFIRRSRRIACCCPPGLSKGGTAGGAFCHYPGTPLGVPRRQVSALITFRLMRALCFSRYIFLSAALITSSITGFTSGWITETPWLALTR